MQQRKTIGLALGGGGVRGMAHVGVLQVLLENNIPIDYIAGTSVGSFMASHFAIHQDVAALEKLSLGYRRDKFFSLLEPTWRGGFVKGVKVERFLKKWLGVEEFADASIPLAVVATDLLTGDPVIFKSGLLIPAVRASISIPLFLQPFHFDGRWLVDGWLSYPIPDRVVREMGADIVISVDLEDYKMSPQVEHYKPTWRDTAWRSMIIIRKNLSVCTTTHTDVLIQPQIAEIGHVAWKKYFTNHPVRDMIESGRAAAEKKLPEIRKLLA
ncbi:MAG: patatin-like phospholipase family protein [Patescibacteria group bacterium]|jgi:NTE family protein